MQTLYIKNMVCDRCKAAIVQQLKENGIAFQQVELGEVTLSENPTAERLQNFRESIKALGFELINDKKSKLIEQIKAEVIQQVRFHEGRTKTNFSEHLAKKLGKDYSTLSALFSQVEGTTIEQYIIRQKVERAKELLVYDELSLSQIADQLNYSSVAHLSNQFKKVTGLTPSYFKNMRPPLRRPLDKIG